MPDVPFTLPRGATPKQAAVFNKKPAKTNAKAPPPPPNWKAISDKYIYWSGEGEKASYSAFVGVGARYWWASAETTYHEAIGNGYSTDKAKKAARFVLDNGDWGLAWLRACWKVGLKP
jgi:hypothetical protein